MSESGCGSSSCGCGGAALDGGHRPEREHWRSLEQLAGTPEAQAFMERKFPVGASELPEGVSRRELVQLLGASLSLAGLAACRRPVENIVPFVTPPEEMIPGIPKRYATTMPFGMSAYGLLVESHECRPTKSDGHELHPATAGSASAQMQASILALYDPDRSAHVMRRGTGSAFEPKAWADFLAAWKELETGYLASGGVGLAVLAPVMSSPTVFRLAGLLRQRFPQMHWVNWEPVNEENALAGVALLVGRALRPVYDTAAAKVILSLDADLFLGESEAVKLARGFADGRRLSGEHDEMNRLWVVESELTTTGAMADHRQPMPSSRIGAFAVALASKLSAAGVSMSVPAGAGAADLVPALWMDVLARDLAANRGKSLVVAGRDQPPAVHAMALALNTALGNLGTTISLRAHRCSGAQRAGLTSLASATGPAPSRL